MSEAISKSKNFFVRTEALFFFLVFILVIVTSIIGLVLNAPSVMHTMYWHEGAKDTIQICDEVYPNNPELCEVAQRTLAQTSPVEYRKYFNMLDIEAEDKVRTRISLTVLKAILYDPENYLHFCREIYAESWTNLDQQQSEETCQCLAAVGPDIYKKRMPLLIEEANLDGLQEVEQKVLEICIKK